MRRKSSSSQRSRAQDPEPTSKTPPPNTRENTELIQSILQELKNALIGMFKIYEYQITTNWEGPLPNRVPSVNGVAKLVESCRRFGLNRIEPEHFMHGTLTEMETEKLFAALDMTGDQLRHSNSAGRYPEFPADLANNDMIQVQLEAGQHRFLAVNELHPNDPEQKWWIIQIYRRPLSVAAFQRLRGNDPITGLSCGDLSVLRFLVLFCV